MKRIIKNICLAHCDLVVRVGNLAASAIALRHRYNFSARGREGGKKKYLDWKMERVIKNVLAIALVFVSVTVNAQADVEMADGMRSEGKIYVVVGIILIILIGLVVYLVTLDRKVKKLENLLGERNSSPKL